MGYNPHKKQSPKIPLTVGLFHDVYLALEEEYGKEYVLKHVSMAAIFIDEKGRGNLECKGSLSATKNLLSLLLMRLAVIEAEQIYKQSNGRTNPGLKDTARKLLEDVWKRIASLEKFDHTFDQTKKP